MNANGIIGFRLWSVAAVVCAGWAWAQPPQPPQDPRSGRRNQPDSTVVDTARAAAPDTAAMDTAAVDTGAAPVPALVDTAALPEGPLGPKVRFEVYLEDSNFRETPMGVVTIEFNKYAALNHTKNFMKLMREGFYDGVTFHRIVPGFILQGGDPKSRINWKSPDLGTGGPGYTLAPEIGLRHVRGAVAAARKGDSVNPERESNGSQFFICLADLPALDEAGYTVFGKVVEGMRVLEKVAQIKNAGPENQNRALSRVYLKGFAEVED